MSQNVEKFRKTPVGNVEKFREKNARKVMNYSEMSEGEKGWKNEPFDGKCPKICVPYNKGNY